MSATPLFDPFPNMPNVTHLGDGRRLIETHDKGHCITMVEPNGNASMVICMNSSSPPPKPVTTGTFHVQPNQPEDALRVVLAAIKDGEPFRIEYCRSSQEIKNAEGITVARTFDPDMAKRICHLLIAHAIWSERKARACTGDEKHEGILQWDTKC